MNAIAPLTRAEAESPGAFRIDIHPVHPRLRHVTLERTALETFFQAVQLIDVENLEYVPFMRFQLAQLLDTTVGGGFGQVIRDIVKDRNSGGFTLGVEDTTGNPADFIKLGTAVGHLLGRGNHDSMSGTYYARFLVRDTDESDSYLRQAYRLFTLHTDGTFVDEATDWLLMMKFEERSARGGESRFLHLDDWAERERFLDHPFATSPFQYKAPGSKNVAHEISRPVFFDSEFGLAMSFIDQFVQPRSMEEANYLHDLSASMESSDGTYEVPLPAGDLVVLNNFFWLHGRAPFEKDKDLHRELMRQRGMFS